MNVIVKRRRRPILKWRNAVPRVVTAMAVETLRLALRFVSTDVHENIGHVFGVLIAIAMPIEGQARRN